MGFGDIAGPIAAIAGGGGTLSGPKRRFSRALGHGARAYNRGEQKRGNEALRAAGGQLARGMVAGV